MNETDGEIGGGHWLENSDGHVSPNPPMRLTTSVGLRSLVEIEERAHPSLQTSTPERSTRSSYLERKREAAFVPKGNLSGRGVFSTCQLMAMGFADNCFRAAFLQGADDSYSGLL
jgi:hypothetical protein